MRFTRGCNSSKLDLSLIVLNLFFSLEEYREYENGNPEIGDDYLKTVGLIIAGDGVQAASLVVGRNIKSEEKVPQKLG